VHLRVMTYNIHRAIGVDRRFRPERIVEIVTHHDPDIALLQEVDAGAPRSRELDLAKELADSLGYPHFAVGHNVDLRRGRYGNATLSRFPIVRERNIDLTISARKRRGCQETRIRVERNPGAPVELEVFNLHLGLSAQERAWQVGLLVRSEEFSASDKAHPFLVGGDFNDWRSLLLPTFTEILGFTCCTQRSRGSALGILSYPAFSPSGALDRIYCRGPVRCVGARACRLRLSRVASDHLPLIVDLELA
jgi:endonuclease/exonuclease/phosphatase family metal-dependent hydrolase